MDFFVALDQLLVSVEPVEREVGFDQAVKSHFTGHAAAHRVEGFLAEHSAQVVAEVARKKGTEGLFFNPSVPFFVFLF